MDNYAALPARAYAQSAMEGHGPQYVIDCDPHTSWRAGPYYQWILLELQSDSYVSSLKATFGPIDGYYHYHIECSLDRTERSCGRGYLNQAKDTWAAGIGHCFTH